MSACPSKRVFLLLVKAGRISPPESSPLRLTQQACSLTDILAINSSQKLSQVAQLFGLQLNRDLVWTHVQGGGEKFFDGHIDSA